MTASFHDTDQTQDRMNSFHFPPVDGRYLFIHSQDQPFILYPGELTRQVQVLNRIKPPTTYLVTNYGRIYNKNRSEFVLTIPGKHSATIIRQLFTASELANEYSQHNISRTGTNAYYHQHRQVHSRRSTPSIHASNHSGQK